MTERDVNRVFGTAPCLEAGNTDGFTIDDVELKF
jgi:hypothetical protein